LPIEHGGDPLDASPGVKPPKAKQRAGLIVEGVVRGIRVYGPQLGG